MTAATANPSKIIRLLIADDHPIVRDGLAAILDNEPDIDVVVCQFCFEE
jgi:DNA-binding NarL/FixJ family response regulator